MARSVTGTFSGTGTSNPISGKSIRIIAAFAGTASVTVQILTQAGTWVTMTNEAGTAYTRTATFTLNLPLLGPKATLRLNCTAHTDNVTYELLAE